MNLRPLRSFKVWPRWGSLTLLILIINAGGALLTLLHAPSFNYLYAKMPLATDVFATHEWWRFFTYMFIHAPSNGIGVFHVLFNMMTLAMFGEVVEKEFGKLMFLLLYIAGGVLSALTLFFELWLRSIFSETYFSHQPTLIMGASGAIMAIVAVYALLRPHVRIYMLLIPYPLKIQTALVAFLAISFGLMFVPTFSFIGHSAHIGGALVGYVWGWIWLKMHPLRHETDFVYTDDHQLWEKEIGKMDMTQLEKEVALITPKVCQSGIYTLTRREAAILRRAVIRLPSQE